MFLFIYLFLCRICNIATIPVRTSVCMYKRQNNSQDFTGKKDLAKDKDVSITLDGQLLFKQTELSKEEEEKKNIYVTI